MVIKMLCYSHPFLMGRHLIFDAFDNVMIKEANHDVIVDDALVVEVSTKLCKLSLCRCTLQWIFQYEIFEC